MNTLIRRTTTSLAVGATLMLAAPGVASAHECMVANQSAQGSKAVANSPMWLSENMATHGAYLFTFEVVYGVTPDEEMLDEAVRLHQEQGLQEWTAFFMGHTLLTNPRTGEDNPAGERHSGDGRGVDHWSDTELGLAMIAIAGSLL
ncbi:hypothetical protein ACQE98_16535 [Ornithinimicrobium sp. W1679]|uniref:hypothetical protein n=1 Tax=Ornithinimicrobium sp. W1679 TaxID=3418770 RepID=UPI003CF083F9